MVETDQRVIIELIYSSYRCVIHRKHNIYGFDFEIIRQMMENYYKTEEIEHGKLMESITNRIVLLQKKKRIYVVISPNY